MARDNYDYSMGDEDDLQEDLLRVKNIKRLLTRYREGGELKERLILNHLTILFNVFDADFVRYYLKWSVRSEDWHVVNTFLLFMQRSIDLVTIDPTAHKVLRDTVYR